MPAESIADPWLGAALPGELIIEQRVSSVDSLYRAQNAEGRNFFARFRRINRLATPPDWTTRARRLATLRSRRIARFISAMEHDEYAVLLSEHVEGERLRDMLRRCGPLAPSTALEIAHQVGVGVEALHTASLTHGRLNPRGIIVCTDARGTLRATIVSYGRASSLEPPTPEAGYLPDDHQDDDRANDVFAIGALLFELLTGVAPAEGTVDAAIRDIAPSPLKNPSAVNPQLRAVPHLDHVVQRLTSNDDRTLRIDEALDLLTEAYDNPSSTELISGTSQGFIGVETGLGSALSSSTMGSPPEPATITRGGLQLLLCAQGTTVTMRDERSAGAPLVLLDIARHGVEGHVSRLLPVDNRLLVGTTRGALLSYDIDSAKCETLCPASDGSAIVAIDAVDEVVIAATRRGSVVCLSADGGHVMAPTSFVTSITVSDNGKRFAVGRTSGAVEVFELVDGVPARIDDFTAAEVTGIRLSADGRELWLSDRDTTTVRDLATHSNFGVVGAAHELVETSEVLAHRDDD